MYKLLKARIKRIDKTLPLPKYQTNGSVAFDLYSRLNMEIKPKSIAIIPANLIIEIPKGYMLMLAARSSTPRRKGLSIPNGIGIIDQDYHGEQDEFSLQVYNFTEQKVKIERGERIGQAVFVRIDTAQWEETDKMSDTNRGGFGSTGKF